MVAHMKLVMVGGHTRNIGKSSVVEGVIAATAQLNWTAIKITQFGHSVCSGECATCDCAADVDQFLITEETADNTHTDTARFLAAGARRSLWVRTKQGELYTAMPALKEEIKDDEFVIVESNSLRRFLEPSAYLQVLDPSKPDFKLSAREFFNLTDAYILVDKTDQPGAWASSALRAGLIQKNKVCFMVREEDRFISAKVIAFVTSRLEVEDAGSQTAKMR